LKDSLLSESGIFFRFVPAVRSHEHGGVSAELDDAPGLRSSVHHHTEAFRQAISPLVAAEFRTVSVDPCDGFDAGLFVDFRREKAAVSEDRLAMA
jgi:hypothetical protein